MYKSAKEINTSGDIIFISAYLICKSASLMYKSAFIKYILYEMMSKVPEMNYKTLNGISKSADIRYITDAIINRHL